MCVESSAIVETCVTFNPGPLAYYSGNLDASRVVVHATCKAKRIACVFAKPVAPHAAEICYRDQHLSGAFEPFVLPLLGVQLLLQIVDVLHQLLVGVARINRSRIVAVAVGLLRKCIETE